MIKLYNVYLNGDFIGKNHRLDKILHKIYDKIDKGAKKIYLYNEIQIISFEKNTCKKMNYLIKKC